VCVRAWRAGYTRIYADTHTHTHTHALTHTHVYIYCLCAWNNGHTLELLLLLLLLLLLVLVVQILRDAQVAARGTLGTPVGDSVDLSGDGSGYEPLPRGQRGGRLRANTGHLRPQGVRPPQWRHWRYASL
jgi:hypothetical protein